MRDWKRCVSNIFHASLVSFVIIFLFFVFVSKCFCEEAVTKNDSAKKRTIKPGDLLEVNVTGHGDISGKATVNDDGKIEFPLIREIHASGKTVTALAVELEERLTEFIKYPRVDVSYKNTFFVYGEVSKPGEYNLEGRINVLKAVTIAGGFTDFASHRVKIIRGSSKEANIWVNVDDIIRGRTKEGKSQILIEPGDVIVVSESLL